MLIGVLLLLLGLAMLWAGWLQWRGRDWTEHNPYLWPARGYLIVPTGAPACLFLGAGLVLDAMLPGSSDLPFYLLASAMVLLFLMILTILVWPGRPMPEWQRRQVAWWEAEEAAGRRVRWSQRPDEVRFGPGIVDVWLGRLLKRPPANEPRSSLSVGDEQHAGEAEAAPRMGQRRGGRDEARYDERSVVVAEPVDRFDDLLSR